MCVTAVTTACIVRRRSHPSTAGVAAFDSSVSLERTQQLTAVTVTDIRTSDRASTARSSTDHSRFMI